MHTLEDLEKIIKSCDIFYCSIHHDGDTFQIEMEYEEVHITGEGETLSNAITDLKKNISEVLQKHKRLSEVLRQLLTTQV